jgi:hypothetical protein
MGETGGQQQMKGVFWLINNELHSFPFNSDPPDFPEGVAKSGDTYNHKKLWKSVKPRECGNKSYNYYPRGRVDISNRGEIIIYMNPNIDESLISEIRAEFGLQDDVTIRCDCSEHYKCYLDDGWKAEY